MNTTFIKRFVEARRARRNARAVAHMSDGFLADIGLERDYTGSVRRVINDPIR
ncbi:MAG: DUF1127 domain-containing protein [Hyphomicrobiales bacterium]|nr:DUF1127 domain-containing protein [Hyphomicrobiales bacterium]